MPVRMAPEMVYRIATSHAGDSDSSDIRMPRYVVPQKKHTDARAA